MFGPDGFPLNAAGYHQVPDLEPPGATFTPPRNLAYEIALVLGSEGSFTYAIWIATVDGESLGSSDLPFIGCLSAIFYLPQSTVKRGQDDNGDFTKVIDQDYVNAILDNAKGVASGPFASQSRAGDVYAHFTTLRCQTRARSILLSAIGVVPRSVN